METRDEQCGPRPEKRHLPYRGKCLGTTCGHTRHSRDEAVTAGAKPWSPAQKCWAKDSTLCSTGDVGQRV